MKTFILITYFECLFEKKNMVYYLINNKTFEKTTNLFHLNKVYGTCSVIWKLAEH